MTYSGRFKTVADRQDRSERDSRPVTECQGKAAEPYTGWTTEKMLVICSCHQPTWRRP